MIKLLGYTVLMMLPALLPAQSSFLQSPDIVWAAEVEQDWRLDIPDMETEWEEGVTTLKLMRTEKNELYWSSAYLSELVYQAVMQKKLPVFADPECQTFLDPQQIKVGLDTLISFDPDTYEEIVRVVDVKPVPVRDFVAWRLRQILVYHHKSATFSTTVEAIAPLIVDKNEHGDSIGLRPLFWFKPANKRQKLCNNDIVWAKKTVGRQPERQVPANPSRPVKLLNCFQWPMAHQIEVLGHNMKTDFYDNWNEKPLTPDERALIVGRIDSIITIDPETAEEKMVIVRNEINIEAIQHFRLVQSWYWDEHRSRLSICLNAVAPMLDVYDREGNYRYTQPLYYRRSNK